MTGRLDGRVAVVTGAGRGIGAGIARLLAAEGAAVVVNDLGAEVDGSGADTGPAATVAQEITDAGGAAVSDGGDVADPEVGERLVRTAVDKFGALDVLVNAAGILRDRMIFNLAEKEWDDVIRVHLKGHFSTTKPASAYWREQRNAEGHYRLINFTSVSGLYGAPGQPNYAAAKMGIVGLTYSCANALARYGVTANAISPGAATRMIASIPTERQRGTLPSDDERSPDNIAPIVAYLASTASDWLTGQVIGARGYEVHLMNKPEPIRHVVSNGPWEPDRLADLVERVFKPAVS
ncbi:SDR family NAD(P)-dependent oxidoreductase [Pseudonocardia sichuanensis]|uniref:NAD(P)-dependent dehydrogenase (Short-subunit alcohol dehydrogenase family) n=1 Tax=Pseudonocardia kunmingensis TaxID=630975 RepID=A0A543DZP6_9PSEU|nr:SDR family NAD(P)-dependent oxidoreductase [Pseudonocardia kunmingensis]TQM14817.1 NAD(P)-dependent dehydrogenase (short-subunit alcohol dehydrogenase family) [Pseudonocardia kunmingensis]